MKRNKFQRAAAIILALVLVTTIGMTGTLAKYVSSFDGDTKTVRAGLFYVVGNTATLTFDMWEGDGSDEETNVASYGDDLLPNPSPIDIIVPGMMLKARAAESSGGADDVSRATIYNYSEVDVKVAIDDFQVNVMGADLSNVLKYRLGDADTNGWQTKAELFANNTTAGVVDFDAFFDFGTAGATFAKAPNQAIASQLAAKGGSVDLFPKLQILWPYSLNGENDGYKLKLPDTISADEAILIPGGDFHDTAAPYVATVGSWDKVAGNSDDADTLIGLAQAYALLRFTETACTCGTPKTLANITHAAACSYKPTATPPVMTCDMQCMSTQVHDATCTYKATLDLDSKTPPEPYYTDGTGPNFFSIDFSIRATQID